MSFQVESSGFGEVYGAESVGSWHVVLLEQERSILGTVIGIPGQDAWSARSIVQAPKATLTREKNTVTWH